MLERDDLEGPFHPRPFCDFFLQSNQLFFFFFSAHFTASPLTAVLYCLLTANLAYFSEVIIDVFCL